MDKIDLLLLDRIQGNFPLAQRPFKIIGRDVELSEIETIKRLRTLKEKNIIRQISAIFDSASLGYQSRLLGMEVSPDKIEEAAKKICAHPGVTHCYERDCKINLWSTLTIPLQSSYEKHSQNLCKLANSSKCLVLKSIKHIKIDARFPLSEDKKMLSNVSSWNPQKSKKQTFSEDDKQAIRLLQRDIPLAAEVFKEIAKESNITSSDLIKMSKKFISTGVMRRFSAVLRHHRAGYTNNIMCALVVPEKRWDAVGSFIASLPQVSHCCIRQMHPDWKYTHYAMIHSKEEGGAEKIIDKITEHTGINDFIKLKTLREFKKVRAKYFTENEE